jgi:hypothetical protein
MTQSSEARAARRAAFKLALADRASRATRRVYAHEQVLSLATEMAHEVYDEIMSSDNELYSDWKALCPDLTPEKCEALFVEQLIPHLLEPARATLARMLAMPQYEHLHESIYDALCKDNILRQGRMAPKGRGFVHVGNPGDGAKATRH